MNYFEEYDDDSELADEDMYDDTEPIEKDGEEDEYDDDFDDEDDGYGNVYITRIPDEKLKFLAETKKTFALSISTGVLYKQVNTLPCVIVRQITEAKADILIQKTSYPECYKFGK